MNMRYICEGDYAPSPLTEVRHQSISNRVALSEIGRSGCLNRLGSLE